MLVDWRRRASRARGVWCGGAMMFAAAAIVTAEVLLRKGLGAVFGTGFVFSGSDEISSYPVRGRHELVDGACAGDARPRAHRCALRPASAQAARASCDLLALLVLGVFVAALLERCVGRGLDQLHREHPLQHAACALPLAWAQLPWFAGIAAVLSSPWCWRSCAPPRRSAR